MTQVRQNELLRQLEQVGAHLRHFDSAKDLKVPVGQLKMQRPSAKKVPE